MGTEAVMKYDERSRFLQKIKELENKLDCQRDQLTLMKQQNEDSSGVQAEEVRKTYYDKLVKNSTVDLANENLELKNTNEILKKQLDFMK